MALKNLDHLRDAIRASGREPTNDLVARVAALSSAGRKPLKMIVEDAARAIDRDKGNAMMRHGKRASSSFPRSQEKGS